MLWALKHVSLVLFTRGITYFYICCCTLHSLTMGLGCFTWGYKVKNGWEGKLLTRFNDPLALFKSLLWITLWFLFRMSSKMACYASTSITTIVALGPNYVPPPASRTFGGAYIVPTFIYNTKLVNKVMDDHVLNFPC